MKQLLKFEESEDYKGRKTKIFSVYSNHSNDFLGTVHFRCGWRCYVMSYARDIDMSVSCMVELCKFMENLEMERKGK